MKNLGIIKFRYLLLAFLQAICFLALAQKQYLQFDHIGANEGLSQSNVICILQDSRGFMWFGTRDGLNKYDGYKFTVYKNDPHNLNSLSNNFIRGFTESKNGDLWIATLGGGVCRYNRKNDQFTTYKHDPKNKSSISSDFITSILEDSEGKIWVGTEAGLNLFNPKENQFSLYIYKVNDKNSSSDIYIRSMFEDSQHNLWLCTYNGGLNLFNRKSKTFTNFLHDEKNSKTISSNNIYTMFEDSKHRLWVGTNGGGLDLFNKESGMFFHYRHDDKQKSLGSNSVYAINEDDNHNLWIGTENGGLNIFNPDSGEFDTYRYDEVDNTSISNNSIYSIYKDQKNNMWIGTFNAGINLVNRDASKFNHYKHMFLSNSLSNNNVLCIYEDSKKNIWVGTDGGGLNLFDPQTGNFTHFRHEKNNKKSICGDYVLSVYEDSNGNLWIGTWADGVTVFNRAKNTFKHFKNDPANASSISNNNAWKIFEDKDKNIWIGTYGGGLNLLNPDNNSFTHYQHNENNPAGISSNNLYSIFQDTEGKIWLSTDGGGLNLFDKKTKTFSHFLHNDNKNSIANNSVSSICEDRNKNLWIGTGAGLSFLDKKTNRFTNYTTLNGLPNNVIFGILEDSKGNLWISTNKGISRYDPLKKIFKNFDVSDGLQSNEFKMQAFCKSAAGTMYFGGNNGFNQFYADNIKPIAFDPPLVITSFRIFNKEVPIAINKEDPSPLKKSITETQAIRLAYKNTDFSFEFASLNYTVSEKKQYAYMLEGFDETWNEAGKNRMATYTNLNPGEYTFKVKGLNNNGEWSPNIVSLQLTIIPPFWLTWWFRFLIILALAGGGLAFYIFRIKIIQVQKKALERRVKMQTAQLLHVNDEEHRARLEAEKAHADSDKAREIADRANKELERKNKELEQFAFVASHDLQEPLRTSASYVKLMQKQYQGQLDEKADKYFDYIVDSSERMKTLIKDLLDFSRIGNKGAFVKADCNKILADVLADLDIAIKDSSAEIKTDDLPVIKGYPTELKQLFQNLIIKAIKFREKDVIPKIHISALKIDDYWQFAFADNGIGIDKQHNEKIFIIFQRLHNRTEYKGSGIGLSHCKKIVELHHGKIWVK
ncbi:MAG: two-component regulator propeller domain-containing protein, partial [Ginsengibacter sp.]